VLLIVAPVRIIFGIQLRRQATSGEWRIIASAAVALGVVWLAYGAIMMASVMA
jgi:hypothetical protein